jgi:isoleucyl-tRNA synthetase
MLVASRCDWPRDGETMTDTSETLDYSKTLYLPQTDFPMRAGLPEKEPLLVKRWQEMDLYRRLRDSAAGRPLYVLHDGPPYANGNIHIGHALNKILKDVITRSFQMRGYDSNYVPGWDCHGLPIEWKIEEENYRAKGRAKPDLSEPSAMVAFRQECRAYAEKWIAVQAQEFQRLGVVGDFDNPYTTMNFHAEARIAGELLKFAMSGQLYRGSKPVMWSVVERTALAEAEVEYQDYESDTIWVKFPVATSGELVGVHVVIWTTTPWTIPGNRAVAYSPRVAYGLYEVASVENDFGPRVGEKLILAQNLAEDAAQKAKLTLNLIRSVSAEELDGIQLSHPLAGWRPAPSSGPSGHLLPGGEKRAAAMTATSSPPRGEGGEAIAEPGEGAYRFPVPMLAGDHVTDDAGTGFVHTAPGHGREDFDRGIQGPACPRHRHRDSLHGRRCRLLHEGCARLRPRPRGRSRARHRRQRQEGRRQQGGHRCADRRRHALRTRAAQAHLSAFLALQEAGHLPQHPPMVRPHGQGTGRVWHEDRPLIRPFGPPSPRWGEERGGAAGALLSPRGEGGCEAAG